MIGASAFPTASYSYFHAVNKEEERRAFLSGVKAEPHFRYANSFSLPVIEERLARVEQDSPAYRSLQLVHVAAQLQQDPRYVAAFRRHNEAIFGTFRQEFVEAMLERARQSRRSHTQAYFDEALELMGVRTLDTNHRLGPSQAVFDQMKAHFQAYADVYYGHDVADTLKGNLRAAGLADQGWTVVEVAGGSHARVNPRAKRIIVGKAYRPRTKRAQTRIAVHEIYGHAVRGTRSSLAESEGFAILLEQLLDDTFKYRRSYRYLAAALGWGALGRPMTFREVFEIVWRLMAVMSRYSPEKAKSHAFDECYRVFRGGRPDVAGAVYLKDGVYFRANIEMWRVLETRQCTYNEFVDIIEGRREVLA